MTLRSRVSKLIGRDGDGVWWVHVWLVGPLVVLFVGVVCGVVALIEMVAGG